jgi:hypothetical protein
MSFQRPADYAGELSVGDAYALLKDDEKAELVDVRSQAEWTWVGVPDLSGLGKTPIFVEWASYPGMRPAADFAQRLIAELSARDAGAVPLSFRGSFARCGARARFGRMAALLQHQ